MAHSSEIENAIAPSICFIESINEEFRVTDAAKAMLADVKGKVVIVCVAGPYRTGKSFLLNKLIGYKDGFKVGSTIRACTKGIWLWGEPVVRDGMTYLFLDTEGLGSTDQALPYDTKIFSLAVLLSSYFILNTQGTINEQALSELELVVNCAQQVRMYDNKSSDPATQTADLATVFPSFLWVLRDFILRLTDEDERPISPSDYLEACLSQRGNNRAKHRTREAIKAVFLQRDCRTLVRPVLDEQQLQSLASVPAAQLRPEFLAQLEALSSFIFANARPKQINGGFVNGSALVELAESYTRVMNGGHMPVIHTAWEAVVLSQAALGLANARSAFASRLNALCPPQAVVEQEVLENALLEAEREAVATLRGVCVGNEHSNRATEAELAAALAESKQNRRRENEEASKLQCREVLSEVWPDNKRMTDEEFSAAFSRASEEYHRKAAGPCKGELWAAFAEKTLLACWQSLLAASIILKEQCAQLQAKKAELSELYAEAVKTAEEQGLVVKRLEGDLEGFRQRNMTMEQQQNASAQAGLELSGRLQTAQEALAQTERTLQRTVSKRDKAKEKLAKTTTELQNERERLFSLSLRCQELEGQQQQHSQQLQEARAASQQAANHSQERLQLTSSLEAQAGLATRQQEQLQRLQEQVSGLEREARLEERGGFFCLDAETLAALFMCLFAVLLSARFGWGPAWLV